MTLKRLSGLIIAAVTVISLTVCTTYAKEDTEPQLLKMHATAYCLQGITASGTPVRKGICATGNRAYLGMTAVIYQRLPDNGIGEIIGIYEVEDTGCKDTVIDVWLPEAECQGFMDRVYENGCKGKIWVQFMEAKG